MEKYHFKPIEINATTKEEIVRLFVDELDPRATFITTDDLQKAVSTAKTSTLCDAYTQLERNYFSGIKRYDSLVFSLLKLPIQFKKGETVTVNLIHKSVFRTTRELLDKRIQQLTKAAYLREAYLHGERDSITFSQDKQLTPALDKKWRDRIVKGEEIYLHRIKGDIAEATKKAFDTFLNAITARYDPHSCYFPPNGSMEFLESLSRETATFGVELNETEDYEFEVAGCQPGSAAWFSGEFTEGTIIEAVENSTGEKIEFSLKGLEFVTKTLSDPSNKSLSFYLRKKTGEQVKIDLVKSEIQNADNSFQGYLLEREQTKLGYIALPSFYTNYQSRAQLGCANDVAKEIVQLKKEGINGLVLDLRNNGGGSIKEALDICGLFISEGPLAVFHAKDEKPVLMKDMNRGTIFDGPLLILVNNSSASASEFVSGCLKDYQRAVIVGEQTFGKGTAQAFYYVDTTSTLEPDKSLGELKITDGKFYHVSQQSNQEIGVTPDFFVNDFYTAMDYYKEKYTPYHFRNDTVIKKVNYLKLPVTYSESTIQQAKKHIENNAYLKLKAAYSDSLKTLFQSDYSIPLEFIPYMQLMKKRTAFFDRLENASINQSTVFKTGNYRFAQQMMKYNETDKKINEDLLKSIQEDATIQESFLIFQALYNQ